MKTRISIAVVFVIGISALWLLSQKSTSLPSIQIAMRSDPFPLVIGPTTLIFSVSQNGAPVDADVKVSADMMMEGMLPVNMQKVVREDGLYKVPVMWPMAGQWMVNVQAQLANGQPAVTETFEVFVYSTSVDNPGGPTTFRSESQNRALDTDPDHQMVIIIPQGTRVLMLAGQAPDVIPPQVHLNVNGRNTLVIQNNDIVDHIIGPYMVRAGETLRQTFTSAATYQGKCSANVKAKVSIIVDG